MSKKLIITLSVLLAVVAVVLILFWTLFALSGISVQFSSTLKNLSISEAEIVEAGGFRKGACVLFEGKKKSIESIYAKAAENENFSYIRVTNIETKFPNQFVIHVAEREELFAVECENGQVYICDRDFRVLRLVRENEFDETNASGQAFKTNIKIKNYETEQFAAKEENGKVEIKSAKTYISLQNNAILLQGLKIENESVKVGDFLQVKQSAMKKFYANMLANNRDLAQQLGKFEKLELSEYADEFTSKKYTKLTLTTFAGRVFEIKNIDFAFAEKIQKMFAVESAVFAGDLESKNIWCVMNENGEYATLMKVTEENEAGEKIEKLVPVTSETEGAVKLSYEIIANCKIVVDNFTLDENVNRTEKDIYYCFAKMNNE